MVDRGTSASYLALGHLVPGRKVPVAFFGRKMQRFMGLQVSQMAPAALHFNIKLPECCFLIPSAVKIIHIIAHGGKLAPQNHKSLKFLLMFYLRGGYSRKK